MLRELGFPDGAFDVALGRRPAGSDEPAVEIDGDAVAFDATGIDAVVFRLRPNPGEPARPLARIASGGELSRVALAIKEVLAAVDDTPTLVFDEIDTGIGGRSADPVGAEPVGARPRPPGPVRHAPAPDRRLRRRPLPDRQARARRPDGDRGQRLDREGRVEELAQMIGGPAGGEAALAVGARAARPRRGVARPSDTTD